MEIRLLDASDVAAYYALRLEALENEPCAFSGDPERMRRRTPEDYLQRIRPEHEGNFVLGAFQNGALVGFVALSRPTAVKLRHKAEVRETYVTPSARGKGIATALLHALIDRAQTYPDLVQLHLMVTLPQEAARRLYESLGFEVRGVDPRSMQIGDRFVDAEWRVLKLK